MSNIISDLDIKLFYGTIEVMVQVKELLVFLNLKLMLLQFMIIGKMKLI